MIGSRCSMECALFNCCTAHVSGKNSAEDVNLGKEASIMEDIKCVRIAWAFKNHQYLWIKYPPELKKLF